MELSRRAFVLSAAALVVSGCSTSDDGAPTAAPGAATTDQPSEPTASASAAPTPPAESSSSTSATPEPTIPLPSGVFSLGVASGDPLPDRVILWTRLDPPPPSPALPDAVTVRWEVSTDIDFDTIVTSGTTQAIAAHAHSVHVDAIGLAPATTYRYRFIAGGQTSTIGTTRTTPLESDTPSALRFGFASCQQYQSGFYAAWRDAAEADLDLIVFLGDYIYESSATFSGAARQLDTTEDVETLEAYRARYALHKRDVDLQAAHASCPWLVIWDDHEVTNNYAGDRVVSSPSVEIGLRERRAWAYQAWWEHQPVRLPAPVDAEFRIYRSWRYGDLINLFLLD
ncbi:MAG: alkaline phosphatase, partial [Acidimicrobiia bacterium]